MTGTLKRFGGPILFLAIVMLFQAHVFAEDRAIAPAVKNIEADAVSDRETQARPARIDLRGAIQRLLAGNSDVKTLLIEYEGAGDALLRNGAKYDPLLIAGAEGGRSVSYNMFTRSTDGVSTARGYGGIEQRLGTGTTLRATLDSSLAMMPETRLLVGGERFDFGGDVYNTRVRLEIAQDLFKNAFGSADRLEKKRAGTQADIQKAVVRARLAVLIAAAVASFYDVADARAELATARADIQSTTGIRDMLALKLTQGLAAPEEAYEWNCRLSQARMAAAASERRLDECMSALLRALDIPPGGAIEIEEAFTVNAPDVPFDSALRDAFAKRPDWRARKLAVERAGLELEMASNGARPSLMLKLGAGGNGYDPDSYPGTLGQGRQAVEYYAGMEMRYPLGDSGAAADEAEAGRNAAVERENLRKIEREIRDEVAARIKDCASAHAVYREAGEAREFARAYYAEVLMQFQRGRVQSTNLKTALDTYTRAEHVAARALLGYNIALLRRDLARNTFIEGLGVDIEALLRKVE
ncbi:MAG: TolC family protein [Spirochaetes bacterium]|nr:MAG: TolC family protein [Spirochaetota bacterium]